MTKVIAIQAADWNQRFPQPVQEQALRALEDGNVLLFPSLTLAVTEEGAQFLSLTTAGRRKNISLDFASGKLRGGGSAKAATRPLRALMERFAGQSKELLLNLLPSYREDLIQARTSFRPVEIVGRTTSWRKDDTRLHIDSFPASPVQGRRILRVFCNLNPHGQNRSWRLGDSFERVARRYVPSLSRPVWGSSQLLRLFRITKSRRSAYDHLMLQLHDRMKADLDYQSLAEHSAYEFPAGSTWIVFTDQVSHAATAGQYLLEQTFYLPVLSMSDQQKSPLRILERLTGQVLT